MELSINTIKRLSEKKLDENWDFRSFLKSGHIPSRKIDALVHKLYQKVSEKIDCMKCMNCCNEMAPCLDKEDIDALSKALNISKSQFRNEYLLEGEEAGELELKGKPCPFLTEYGCAYYKERPKACKSFPHLHKKDFIFRLMGVVQNCSICPIVFNVYEDLKNELGWIPKKRSR